MPELPPLRDEGSAEGSVDGPGHRIRWVKWAIPYQLYANLRAIHEVSLKHVPSTPESEHDFALGMLSLGLRAMASLIEIQAQRERMVVLPGEVSDGSNARTADHPNH